MKSEKSLRKAKGFFNNLSRFLIISLVLLTLYIIDWGFLRGEITKYPIWYSSELGYYATLNKTIFKPDAKNQEVFARMPGISVDRYTNCVVVNRRNWKCTYDDKSGSFGFTDGQYWNVSHLEKDFGKMDEWQYVPRFVYLYHSWKGLF